MVAAAVVGSAVVGGVATSASASRASGAAERGAASAADATLQGTMLQIQEIQRQFDFQQQLLAPFVANQYAAQGAYQDLLGIGGGAGANPPPPGTSVGPGGAQDFFQQPDGSYRPGAGGGRLVGPGDRPPGVRRGPNAGAAGGGDYFQGGGDPNMPAYPTSGSTSFQSGDRGQFVDPNIDQTRLADINTLPGTVQGNLLAGDNLQDDALYTDVLGRSLADGAAGTSVYGDTFQESPGYAFQVEEMNRALDRKNSAGGNYGGRAIMEAQRRAQGLAAGDYYNWAQGRSRDVDRMATAESRDASRLDAAGVNYFGRRAGDAARLDSAASQEDRLMAGDQARGDQAYYNYLAQLAAAGGVGGNAVGTAVNSSQAAGQGIGNAYGAQGRGLANIYGGLGQDQANIYGSAGASYNDIFQGGMGNLITAGVIT